MKRFSGFIASTSAASFSASPALPVGDGGNYFICVIISGSDVAGTLKLQASDNATDWFDVANSSTAITASADAMWNISDVNYPYVRVAWTYTSGTGNISGRATIRETQY